MLKKSYTILLAIASTLLSTTSNALNEPIGGKASGMSNASVTNTDCWAIQHNQAGLAYTKNISAGLYYENRFGLKNMSFKTAVLVIPTKAGTIGASMTYFGYDQFNESTFGIAYAKSFGEKFSAGMKLNVLRTSIADNYGQQSTIAAEVGIRYQLNKNLIIGSHVYNPTRAKKDDYNDERIPTIVNIGCSYMVSEKVHLALESEKNTAFDPILKIGIEYHPVKMLYLRTGVSTNPLMNAFGFGIEYPQATLDFAMSYHQTLGFTPHVSIVFHSAKKKASTP